MQFVDIFNSSKLTENLVKYYSLNSKLSIIKENNVDYFNNYFENTLKNHLYTDLQLVLVEMYHSYKENKEIQGNTKTERYEHYKNFISQNKFYEKLFESYPVLEELLQTSLTDFFNSIIEVLDNFNNEKETIYNTYPNINGEIVDISLEMGDKHNGRTVSKVAFEDGALFYKPNSLKSDEFFNQYLAFMGEKAVCDFKDIKTLSFEDHSWQIEVQQKPCYSIEEVERYFYRSGVLLSLMYALGSYDMHLENIIAAGEYPIIVDTETFTSAGLVDFKEVDDKKDLDSSVLNTSMLPVYNELYDINMSGLFTKKETSESIYYHTLQEDEENDIVFKRLPAETEMQQNVVILNNEVMNPHQFEKELLQGFNDGAECIIRNKTEFIELLSNKKNNELQVRQILRGTQVYYTFLRESKKPNALKDENLYTRLFNILYKGFTPSKHGYLRVEEEIKSLKTQNVPYFYTMFNDTHLYSRGEIICKNYYELTPQQNILSNIESLDKSMVDYQKHLIRLSLFTATQTEDAYIGGKERKEIVTTEDNDRLVKQFIEGIKNVEVPNNYTNTSTFYIAQMRDSDDMKLDQIDAGMYMGGGIVHLLYSYASKYHNHEIKELSKRLLYGLHENYRKVKMVNDKSIPFSLYEGYGGLVYLLYNFFKLNQDKEIYRMFEEMLNDFFKEREEYEFGKLDNDFVNGLGGFTLFLSRLYFDIKKKELKVKIRNYLVKYSEYLQENSLSDVGLAHGISGICINLSYLYKITNDHKVKASLFSLLDKEEALIKNQLKNDEIQFSWCKGLSGILLSRVIIWENVKHNKEDDDKLRKIIDCYVTNENLESMVSLNNPCLCHGTMGNVDVLSYVNKHYDIDLNLFINKQYYSKSALESIEWFEGSDYPFESFMIGLSGAIYGVLHQNSDKIPSINAIEFY